MKWIIPALFISSAHANVMYDVAGDDFSNGKTYSLKIGTEVNKQAVIMMTCFPSGNVNIQLRTRNTIFPDSADDGAMQLSVTHKMVSDEEPQTSTWNMNLMKYYDAWYQGDEREFIKDAMAAKGVNLRLNKVNSIYKFDFEDSNKHMKEILEKCPV